MNMSENTMNRRAFLRSLALAGAGAALVPSPVLAAIGLSETEKQDGRFKVAETRFLMGTYVSITAMHESKAAGQHAIGCAFEEIERLSAIFDRHRADTPVSFLNRSGYLNDAGPELGFVLDRAHKYSKVSSGAFDVTVLPVVEVLKRHSNPSGRMDLARGEMAEALALVDSDSVKLGRDSVRFARQGMSVTLDGIGKGFIVDRASEVLAENGVRDHLVNAGGDLRAQGERSPGRAWKIAIQDPSKKGGYLDVIRLRNGAIATSGGYEVYYDAAHSHHHVVNPKNAYSPTQSVSVSATATTVMEADALSTSVFVMAPKTGVHMVDSLPHSECLVIGDSGARVSSRNWRPRV